MQLKKVGSLALQLSLIITLCTTTYFVEKSADEARKPAPTITIWVHGSKTLPTSVYKLIGFEMPMGLNKLTKLMQTHATKRMLTEFITALCANDTLIDKEHTYLFGWPGDLDPVERKAEAQKLYRAIEELVYNYQNRHHCTPTIRMITHSHGGNVALNLARVAQEEGHHTFTISELILLACPVWKANESCLDHEIFTRVYHLYSKADLLQVMDPQRWYKEIHGLSDTPFLSGRTFTEHPKLIQTAIDFPIPIQHGLFICKPFLPRLAQIKKLIDQEYQNNNSNYRIKMRWNPFTQWIDVRAV